MLEYLETVPIASDINLTDFRFPVQYVIRPMSHEHHDYRGYAGEVASGTFRPGDEAERLTRRFHFDLRNERPDAWFERFIDALSRERGDASE